MPAAGASIMSVPGVGMRRGRRIVFFVLLCFCCRPAVPRPADEQRIAAAVQPMVEDAMRAGRIPSLTIALVAGERVIWAQGFGLANLRAKTAATPETVYLIGSTFKTMSAFLLLQQMERGKFRLDNPVGPYLGGLAIRGEVAGRPVTFRHLLTHTSGLPTAFGAHPVWGDTVPRPLAEYLRDALRATRPPLERLEYSNLAFTLVAYLVERLTGTEFRRLIRQRLFTPLEMTSTEFAPRPDMEERLAIPYVVEAGRQEPVARTKADVWPAGIVYGTVQDMAHWLIVNLNGGEFRGKRLLRPETLEEMHRRQYDKFAGPTEYGFGNATTGYGLAWITSRKGGERYIAHSGSVAGYTAFLLGNLDRRLGCAILTNGNRAHRHIARLAEEALVAASAP